MGQCGKVVIVALLMGVSRDSHDSRLSPDFDGICPEIRALSRQRFSDGTSDGASRSIGTSSNIHEMFQWSPLDPGNLSLFARSF
jgi:hypothetical protein